MSDKPQRRFWQIHLSTAVMLMFVASALGFCNVTLVIGQSRECGDTISIHTQNIGLPFPALERITTMGFLNGEIVSSASQFQIQPLPLAGNICIGLLLLFGAAQIFESRIRRRESRKP